LWWFGQGDRPSSVDVNLSRRKILERPDDFPLSPEMLAFLEEEKRGLFFEQEFAKEEGEQKEGRRPRPEKGVTMKVNQVKVKIPPERANCLRIRHSCLYDSFIFRVLTLRAAEGKRLEPGLLCCRGDRAFTLKFASGFEAQIRPRSASCLKTRRNVLTLPVRPSMPTYRGGGRRDLDKPWQNKPFEVEDRADRIAHWWSRRFRGGLNSKKLVDLSETSRGAGRFWQVTGS